MVVTSRCLKSFKSRVSSSFLRSTGIACLICQTFLMCGATRMFTPYLISELKLTQRGSQMNINENEASWLACFSSLWNPVGFVFGGYTMDAFGRKWSTKCVFVPFLAGWMIIMNATTPSTIYAGIALHGIASGMTMTSSFYISEISPPEYRGFSLSLLGISYMLGMVVCSVLQCLVSWMCTAACFFVASAFMFGATYLVPESPYWLIMRGRVDDAAKILASIRNIGIGDGMHKAATHASALESEILDIKRCVQATSSQRQRRRGLRHRHRHHCRHQQHDGQLRQRRADDSVMVDQGGGEKTTIGNSDEKNYGVSVSAYKRITATATARTEAIARRIRDTVFALRSVWKQLSILTTFAILHKMTGYTPLAQYTVTFFSELRTPLNGTHASLVHSIVCLGSTLTVPYFVHHYDRRVLLSATSVIAGCGMAVALLYEVAAAFYAFDRSVKPYCWTPLLGVYTYDVASTLGITSVLIMLPAELLPTESCGVASAAFSTTCSVVTTVIGKTYLTAFARIGLVSFLSIFVSSCFLLAVLAVVILPETRGKTLHEIQNAYFVGPSTPAADNAIGSTSNNARPTIAVVGTCTPTTSTTTTTTTIITTTTSISTWFADPAAVV